MREIKEIIDNGDGTQTMILGDWIEPEYGVPCLICGNTIKMCGRYDHQYKICDECKQAIAWAKEKMKEKDDELQ